MFRRDDQRLQQLREKDGREKDPNFISKSYCECYPGYQEYNREIVDSDDEDDLSKLDMGGRDVDDSIAYSLVHKALIMDLSPHGCMLFAMSTTVDRELAT
ncbi:hypothetical protein HN51_047786 [Arachis hypogaea]